MGQTLAGGIIGVMMGVIVIAGIYQFNKKGSPLVPAAQSITTTTLTSLFK